MIFVNKKDYLIKKASKIRFDYTEKLFNNVGEKYGKDNILWTS